MLEPGTAVRISPDDTVGVIRDYIVVSDQEAMYLIQLLSGRHEEFELHRVRALNESSSEKPEKLKKPEDP